MEVRVTNGAVQNLQGLLEAQGRLSDRDRGGQNLMDRLQKIADKEFESGKTIRFETGGGGWAVDISRYFDDQMLYLIVNSQDGKRVGVSVVDESDLEDILRPADNAPNASVPRASVEQQDPIPISHRDPPQRAISSEEPTLLRRLLGEGKVDEKVVPFGQVAAEVQVMLGQGVKPEQIEIWTRRQRPRVKVELE